MKAYEHLWDISQYSTQNTIDMWTATNRDLEKHWYTVGRGTVLDAANHSFFWIVWQYGRKDSYRVATTPLVEHAPAPEKQKKGKKDGKKDKLEDLKQELEMVHSIKNMFIHVISITL